MKKKKGDLNNQNVDKLNPQKASIHTEVYLICWQ